ncbi:MAG: hypothetical protein J4432_02880 [DPANN group archaeon]|nr:hypothetical protein [DPANN group archaeon]
MWNAQAALAELVELGDRTQKLVALGAALDHVEAELNALAVEEIDRGRDTFGGMKRVEAHRSLLAARDAAREIAATTERALQDLNARNVE